MNFLSKQIKVSRFKQGDKLRSELMKGDIMELISRKYQKALVVAHSLHREERQNDKNRRSNSSFVTMKELVIMMMKDFPLPRRLK